MSIQRVIHIAANEHSQGAELKGVGGGGIINKRHRPAITKKNNKLKGKKKNMEERGVEDGGLRCAAAAQGMPGEDGDGQQGPHGCVSARWEGMKTPPEPPL